MTERIRIYTYRVAYVTLIDYYSTPKGTSIPVIVEFVTGKNAHEVTYRIKQENSRCLVLFLSAKRVPYSYSNSNVSIKMMILTPRQLHLIKNQINAVGNKVQEENKQDRKVLIQTLPGVVTESSIYHHLQSCPSCLSSSQRDESPKSIFLIGWACLIGWASAILAAGYIVYQVCKD